jgi:hypothetical protein
MLAMPAPAKVHIAGVEVWRWFGFIIRLGACLAFIHGARRLGSLLASRET